MDSRLILKYVVPVFGLLSLFFSRLFLDAARSMSNERKKNLAVCTEKTEAKIVEVKKVLCEEFHGALLYDWFPVYRHMAGGKPHTVKDRTSRGESDFRIGQITVLYYSPEDPELIYVPSDTLGTERGYFIIGIGLLAAGMGVRTFF